MNGSQKQIEWAEQIKASFVDTLKGRDENSFFSKLNRVGANKVAAGKLTAERAAEVVVTFEQALASVLANDSAKFWIDGRHNPGMILDAAAREVISA